MSNVIISLFYMKISSIFLSLEVYLLQIKQMLIVENVEGLNFILNHFLLIVFEDLSSMDFLTLQFSLEF
jgi:hypothetical protein